MKSPFKLMEIKKKRLTEDFRTLIIYLIWVLWLKPSYGPGYPPAWIGSNWNPPRGLPAKPQIVSNVSGNLQLDF